MRLSVRQHKFSRMMSSLLNFIFSIDYEVSFEGFTRPNNKLKFPNSEKQLTYQEILVFNKRSKVKYGKHNMKLAGDLTIFKNGKVIGKKEYRQFGEYWESIGGRWGGRFKVKPEDYDTKIGWDANHFEGK